MNMANVMSEQCLCEYAEQKIIYAIDMKMLISPFATKGYLKNIASVFGNKAVFAVSVDAIKRKFQLELPQLNRRHHC